MRDGSSLDIVDDRIESELVDSAPWLSSVGVD